MLACSPIWPDDWPIVHGRHYDQRGHSRSVLDYESEDLPAVFPSLGRCGGDLWIRSYRRPSVRIRKLSAAVAPSASELVASTRRLRENARRARNLLTDALRAERRRAEFDDEISVKVYRSGKVPRFAAMKCFGTMVEARCYKYMRCSRSSRRRSPTEMMNRMAGNFDRRRRAGCLMNGTTRRPSEDRRVQASAARRALRGLYDDGPSRRRPGIGPAGVRP